MRARLENALGRLFIGLPDAVVRALVGPPVVRDGRTLDAQAHITLRGRALAGRPETHELSVEEVRRSTDQEAALLAPSPLPAVGAVQDATLDGVPVRIYRPAPKGSDAVPQRPALLYFHGGGHVTGSLESHASVCQVLCALLDAVVVNVGYRLAPEHRFPAAVDDCVAVFRAAVRDAASLGIDPARIAVGGDSAGGNLAAVVSLVTRADAVAPRAQLLIYPVVDLTISSPSTTSLGKGFLLERETIEWFRSHYLEEHQWRDPRASPLFAPDLRGLAPAVVVTAGFDPLRDEGDAYARRLMEAGVPVDHRSYASLFHGFFNTSGVIRAARAAVHETAALLKARL